jgi:hypothetical protein
MGDLLRARWGGRPGRLEVWYATFTDPADGSGCWIHCETVAPTNDGGPPFGHGWIAWFPPAGPPRCERFGPAPVLPGSTYFAVAGCSVDPGRLRGAAGAIEWDLAMRGGGEPLFTFPRVAWERELLPAAQIVPVADGRFSGTVTIDGRTHAIDDARGALARIYGHGNARRWGWLHAALDGGGVCEVVAAVSTRPGLRLLPPVAMVQLRLPGEDDWPANPLGAAIGLRTKLRPDGFTVRGAVGRRRVRIEVGLPPDRCVVLGYHDPDGATATCTNSERADASIALDDWVADRWRETRRWDLDGTAHAEVGTRP